MESARSLLFHDDLFILEEVAKARKPWTTAAMGARAFPQFHALCGLRRVPFT